MSEQEMMTKLDRLNEIIHEAKGIIESLEFASKLLYSKKYDDISIRTVVLETNSISTRFQNVCEHEENIQTIGDLLRTNSIQFSRNRNVGKKVIKQVREFLKQEYDVDW